MTGKPDAVRILLTTYRAQTVCARFVGLRLTDAEVLPRGEGLQVGDIVIGKVSNLQPQIHAAFLSLGQGPDAYLNLDDPHEITYVKGDPLTPLKAGDELLVQVLKEAHGDKHAAVSANLMFEGRLVVLMTGKKTLGVSSKLLPATKERLRSFAAGCRPEDFGLIVRTQAAISSEAEIEEEIRALSAEARRSLSEWKMRTCYSVVRRAQAPEEAFVRRFCAQGIDEIVTDLPAEYARMQKFLADAALQIPLRLYDDGKMPLRKVYSLETQVEKALSKKVRLPSGAWISIEQTEAMTVIDVNSGKSMTGRRQAKKTKREAVLRINREAACEIARQIRLRNLSGIIVIDFIDMETAEDAQEILSFLRAGTADDSAGVHVVDMTSLQLCEMTRRRQKKPLREQILLDSDPE